MLNFVVQISHAMYKRDVTVTGEGGVWPSVTKRDERGTGGSKISKITVTEFMNDPLGHYELYT